MSNLYGTEIEIWAGFGLVGSTEKIWGADYEQLLRAMFSWAILEIFLNCSVCTKKLHNILFAKKT